MAYDGCTVQMMDQLIDLTSQVNLCVEELKRTRERPGKLDRLDKLDKLPSRRRRRPRDSMLRDRAAMPGPTLSPTKSTPCTSSPLCAADATSGYPKPTSSAAGVLDGDPGSTSKSDFPPSSLSSYPSSACTYSSSSFPPLPHTAISTSATIVSQAAALFVPTTAPTDITPPPSSRPHQLPTPPGSSSSTLLASPLAIPARPPPTPTDHRAAIGPAPILHRHRQSPAPAKSATPAQHCGPAGADHTCTRLGTDSMPSATLSPPTEASNNNFLCASLDSTTARNSHSSCSTRSPLVHRVHGRWHATPARSARSSRYLRSVRSFDHLHIRSPSPMFNPFARGSRQRHADGVDATARGSSSGGLMSGMDMSPSSMSPRASNGRTRRSYSTGRRVLVSGNHPPPPLTREEFEALPVAIQRKYFSTLERLRFAQSSPGGQVDGIYHYDAVTSPNVRRHRTRQDGIVSDSITTRLRRKRSLRESPSLFGSSAADTIFYASLPEKIRKREFTREEQVRLTEQLRASVILDAADEAIYKIGRRSSVNRRRIAPDLTSRSFRHSMDTIHSNDPRLVRRDALGLEIGPSSSSMTSKRTSGVPESFYDSFHFEEDEDLDLRLFLDDYHSNLRDQLPSSQNKDRQPSFRRHLSVRKPFSRPPQTAATGVSGASGVSRVSSIAGSTRPVTKDDASAKPVPSSASPSANSGGNVPFPSFPVAAANPTSPAPAAAAAPTSAPATHVRRKSRTLSLIAPRQHTAQTSVSTIDPGAAHYQDPEARLKLRVYLASPQKFDEAIEFGFPSTDVLSAGGSTVGGTASVAAPCAAAQRQRNARQSTSNGSNSLRTFLVGDDDDDKLDSDQASVPDPESPKTPHLIPEVAGPTSAGGGKAPFRPYRLSTEPSLCHRPSDSYAQVPANSREMTLRMTLTRLDLRAGEDQIYGWQQPPYQVQGSSSTHQAQPSQGRKSSSLPNYTLKGGDDFLHDGGATPKMSMSPALLSTPSMAAGPALSVGGPNSGRPKESIENVFAGIDHWEAVEQDKGVMKRFWNRVRRS